jgi:hypothetical protein
MAQDTKQDTSIDWGLTDLHTMIVNTHEARNIAIGKVMRVALLAAAEGKFALRDHKGSKLNLTQGNRDALEGLAAEAEQQSQHRWWTKPPWTDYLRCCFVYEEEFFSSLDNDAAQTAPEQQPQDNAGPDPFKTGAAGRPTPMTIIQQEAERRIREGEVDPLLRKAGDVANELAEWWEIERLKYDPPGPSVKTKTIYGYILPLWRNCRKPPPTSSA